MKPPTPQTPAPAPVPARGHAFVHELRTFAAGSVLDELDEAMLAVNKMVKLTGNAGSVSVTYTVKPAGKGLGAVQHVFSVSSKKPKPDPQPVIRFIDDDGMLVKDDPRQKEFHGQGFTPAVVTGGAPAAETLPTAANQ